MAPMNSIKSVNSVHGLVVNYVCYLVPENHLFEPIGHPFHDYDKQFAALCDEFLKLYPLDVDETVKLLASNELSFFIFASAFEKLGLTTNGGVFQAAKVIAAVAVCGAYIKNLYEMENKGELPNWCQNAAKFRYQAVQTANYIIKMIDCYLKTHHTPYSSLISYISDYAPVTEQESENPGIIQHSFLMAAVVVAAFAIYRYVL